MNKVLNYVLVGLVFLIPLFFLPITQEYFLTAKTYLLAFGGLLVVTLATVNFFTSKKIYWKRGPLDAAVFLVLITAALSALIPSPNKVAALTNLNFGLIGLLALTVFYFAVEQVNHRVKVSDYLNVLSVSGLVVAVFSIFFFFKPLQNVAMPDTWAFLKSPTFNLVGGQIDLLVFLGFVLVLYVGRFLVKRERLDPVNLVGFVVVVLALALSLYPIVKSLVQGQTLLLPPYRLSWYSAVEVLKNPVTALFGVGLDNFASVFTKVKDLAYNQGTLWQIASFNIGRSALLHVMSVAGLFGAAGLVILLFSSFRTLQKRQSGEEKTVLLFGLGAAVVAVLLLPPSFMLWFLLFLIVALINKQAVENTEPAYMPLGGLVPVYVLVLILAIAFVGASSFFLGKLYLSEFYFKKSLDGLVRRNAAELYNNQRKAVQLNPYNEGFRSNFAQTNILIANNVANRARQAQQKEGQTDQNQQVNLTEQERQTIAQAVQAAIQEAKAAVVLNPQKATYWENLAQVYRGIINVAKGADVWTLSSYQRAIALDPRNTSYYLNLGGVFFAAGNYNQSTQLFSQSAGLKPDWANAHYNLAWSLYQQKNYQGAANEMQTVLTLLASNKGSNDYKKAAKELEEFKKKIPPAENPQSTQSGELQLPQQPEPQLSPKLELPKNSEPPKTASPSAK